MAESIQLRNKTSVEGILTWSLDSDVEITINRSSSFEPGSEGVALSALRTIATERRKLDVVFDFPEPTNEQELLSTLIAGPFGFSITRLARSIYFGGGKKLATKEFKNLLAVAYRQNHGMFGGGKSKSFICADPVHSIPPIFQPNITPQRGDFPPPSAIARVLRASAETMGFEKVFKSQREEPLLSLIYELFLNSYEHGQPSEGAVGRSTRALIVEKIVLQAGDIEERNISPDLKDYFRRIANDKAMEVGLGVLCVTIADQGTGIQNTLSKKFNDEAGEIVETPEDKFIRAFKKGESRKSSGPINRGFGLAHSIEAAFKLNALIDIWSDDLRCREDFSSGETRYPSLSHDKVTKPSTSLKFGTVVTVFLPEYATSPDQDLLI